MVDLSFCGLLLTLLVLTAILQARNKTPEKLTTYSSGSEYADPQYGFPEKFSAFVPWSEYADPENESPEIFATYDPEYEYADSQYESDSFVPSPSVSEDSAKFPAETAYIPSDYDEINAPEEHIQLDPTGIAPTEMKILYQDGEGFPVTTELVEIDAKPTVQVDTNTTVTNDTLVIQTENIPLATAMTHFKFVTVMLTIVSAALFITTVLIMCNNNLIFLSIKYKIVYIINSENSENTEVVKVKDKDLFTI